MMASHRNRSYGTERIGNRRVQLGQALSTVRRHPIQTLSYTFAHVGVPSMEPSAVVVLHEPPSVFVSNALDAARRRAAAEAT